MNQNERTNEPKRTDEWTKTNGRMNQNERTLHLKRPFILKNKYYTRTEVGPNNPLCFPFFPGNDQITAGCPPIMHDIRLDFLHQWPKDLKYHEQEDRTYENQFSQYPDGNLQERTQGTENDTYSHEKEQSDDNSPETRIDKINEDRNEIAQCGTYPEITCQAYRQ